MNPISEYVYDDPLKSGHKKFYLTKKQHNELFKNRKICWTDRYEYYYNENHIILHKFINMKAKILQTMLFPVVIIVYGVGNFKEIIREYKELYNEKKYGSFVSDHVSRGSKKYDEVIQIINSKKGEA